MPSLSLEISFQSSILLFHCSSLHSDNEHILPLPIGPSICASTVLAATSRILAPDGSTIQVLGLLTQ
jgi:hypothetical protein